MLIVPNSPLKQPEHEQCYEKYLFLHRLTSSGCYQPFKFLPSRWHKMVSQFVLWLLTLLYFFSVNYLFSLSPIFLLRCLFFLLICRSSLFYIYWSILIYSGNVEVFSFCLLLVFHIWYLMVEDFSFYIVIFMNFFVVYVIYKKTFLYFHLKLV